MWKRIYFYLRWINPFFLLALYNLSFHEGRAKKYLFALRNHAMLQASKIKGSKKDKVTMEYYTNLAYACTAIIFEIEKAKRGVKVENLTQRVTETREQRLKKMQDAQKEFEQKEKETKPKTD